MRTFVALTTGSIVLACSLLAQAEEVILTNGKRAAGTLELDDKGRLRFTPAGQSAALSFSEVQQVRFSSEATFQRRPATVHQVHLPDGQRITGEFIELNEKELKLRPLGRDPISFPRSAVVAVTHPPGLVTILDEDFENDLKQWKLSGAPTLSNRQQTSGKQSLRFDGSGQGAEYLLAAPLQAGRVNINFHDPGKVVGTRWLVEAEYARAGKPWIVRIAIAGDAENYTAEVADARGQVGVVARSVGWHQLSLRWDHDYLLVGVDEQRVWSGGKEGPGGPLQKLRLLCVAQGNEGAIRGEVFFDDLSLARAVDRLPHRVEDATQDEAWLLAGDQLLGQVLRADRRTIHLQMRTGLQKLEWGEVRGVFLRKPAAPAKKPEGEQVRLWLHTGMGGEADQLEGIVRSLDARRLVLGHPLLGDLEIERPRLQRLVPERR